MGMLTAMATVGTRPRPAALDLGFAAGEAVAVVVGGVV